MVVTLAAFPAEGRGGRQRVLDVVVILVGGWTLVASRVLSIGSVRWLSFAAGCALCLLALAGLIAHELLMERAVRPLPAAQVNGGPGPELEARLAERTRAGAVSG